MEDAMAVAYFRGVAASQLLLSNPMKGSMAAIGMSVDAVMPYLTQLTTGKAVVACINSPSNVTVSGDACAIDELLDVLRDQSVFMRPLNVDVAYHSHHMELIANEYLSSIDPISPRPYTDISSNEEAVAFFSSVTGAEIQPDELASRYWVSNLLGQVQFSHSLTNLCFETKRKHGAAGAMVRKRAGAAKKPSIDCILEIGPHSALSGPINQILQSDLKLKAAKISYLSILSRNIDAVSTVLQAASTLATLNYPVDLSAINFPAGMENRFAARLLMDMPPYCWNHTRSYWAEPRLSITYRQRRYPRTDLLGSPDNMACSFEPRWRNHLRLLEIPWLIDHKIQSNIVYPAAGYISMAIEAITQLIKSTDKVSGITMQEVSIRSALIIPEDRGVEVMTSFRRFDRNRTNEGSIRYEFHIYSVTSTNRWTEHCSGLIGVKTESDSSDRLAVKEMNGNDITLLGEQTNSISVINVHQLYELLQNVGLEYGPHFSNLTSARRIQNGTCFGEITIPDTGFNMPMKFQHPLLVHPCTLDSIFHTIFAALPESIWAGKNAFIPVFLHQLYISSEIDSAPLARF
ncbi:Polyketide synthase [Penicillium macrosclerotiorum]|uniref:Polyketide synthase n=1 Tax=Penicillium macrosclerotiorum TaxID=303699 RepID=UPI0025493B0F|nr:Polyketide synthase [Penicillium macrosclerotiorum]KAJ5683539.1 Polyketide synthase [Penicillium macrosclerotiorum]